MKQCSKCKTWKDKEEFGKCKRDGFFSSCKVCRNLHNRVNYYKNHVYQLTRSNKYYHSHKEQHSKWRKSISKEVKHKWYMNSRKKAKANPMRVLHHRMSTAIYIALQQNKNNRKWQKTVGYTLKELKEHIESKFVDGMNWDNIGEWHIDHIIPKAFFKFKDDKDVEFRMCWRLENLQPLWAEDNYKKHDRVQYA